MPDSLDSVDIAIRFREFLGSFVEHCHNTQHEDNAMLLRWDAQQPGQTIVIPTPIPSWEGVTYEQTVTLPTYKIGDLEAKANFEIPGACTPTQTVETLCSDGIDNDCDGLVDAADPSCQAPVCRPRKAACTVNADCCSNKCGGRAGAKTCR